MRQCSLHMVDLCLNYVYNMRQCSLHMVDLCLNYCIQYETVFTAHGRFVFKLLYYETLFTAHGRFVFTTVYNMRHCSLHMVDLCLVYNMNSVHCTW